MICTIVFKLVIAARFELGLIKGTLKEGEIDVWGSSINHVTNGMI